MNLKRLLVVALVSVGFLFAAQARFAHGSAEKSTSSTQSSAPATTQPMIFRISTTSVPSDWHTKALYVFKDYMDKHAPGLFNIQIYPSGVGLAPSALPRNIHAGAGGMRSFTPARSAGVITLRVKRRSSWRVPR